MSDRRVDAIKTLIIEDHTIVRQGIIALLSTTDEIHIIDDLANGILAIEYLESYQGDIDLLLCDLALPGLSGIEVIERASKQGIKCIALSMHHDSIWVQRALDAGAMGYVLKGADVSDLIGAIRIVNGGVTYLSPSITYAAHKDVLTTRERQVLTFVAQGHTSKEISGLLEISPRTVEHHRANMMNKLRINDVAGLTRYAIRNGLVDPQSR